MTTSDSAVAEFLSKMPSCVLAERVSVCASDPRRVAEASPSSAAPAAAACSARESTSPRLMPVARDEAAEEAAEGSPLDGPPCVLTAEEVAGMRGGANIVVMGEGEGGG